jgi:sulfide:quinone oxidoreductase
MVVDRKRVVVVGGSFGGVNFAYALRRKLRDRVDITVISRDADFTFMPSLPWVIMGWRDPARIQVGLHQPLTSRGVRFVHDEVRELDAARGELRTATETFPYDYLLVASGADLDYAAVTGIGPAAHTHSTFSTDEAVLAREALARVLAGDEGRIIVGAAPGASCIGPAYEVILMIEATLRKARKRERFRLTFLTPEPFLGHFGVDGIGDSRRSFEREFATRNIDTVVNSKIVGAEPGRLTLADGSMHAFDFSLIIPAFLGSAFARYTEGLSNPKGFVQVTRELRSSRFENIYAAGVAIAIAPPGPTPVPVAVPKTGGMTDRMAHVAAHNIAADITGGTKIDGLTLAATCIADAGDTAFWMAADPFLPPRHKARLARGKWARYLKIAFERYYLARIRNDWPGWEFGW